jgi:hypothetical protein
LKLRISGDKGVIKVTGLTWEKGWDNLLIFSTLQENNLREGKGGLVLEGQTTQLRLEMNLG